MIESKISDKYGFDKAIQIHETEQLEREAQMAFVLIERWGMVAGIEDGEDSAGRARVRLSTPSELVARAFAVARLAMDRARQNGLVHTTPSIADVELATKEAEEERDRKRQPSTN